MNELTSVNSVLDYDTIIKKSKFPARTPLSLLMTGDVMSWPDD
jgi:hypothetical protein